MNDANEGTGNAPDLRDEATATLYAHRPEYATAPCICVACLDLYPCPPVARLITQLVYQTIAELEEIGRKVEAAKWS